MKNVLLAASLLLSAASRMAAAEDDKLGIDVTYAVECERKAESGDYVEMHYRGTLAATGTEFDASYKRGKPFGFMLGSGQVIKGWDEGLVGMCIGEKRTLRIPPQLGYGQRAMGPIPAGSTLVFETELMGISGVPTPEKITPKKVEEATEDSKEAAKEAAKEATKEAKENAEEAVKDAKENTEETVKDAKENTEEAIKNAKGNAEEAAEGVKSDAEDATGSASSAVEGASESVGENIVSVVSSAAEAAKTFLADTDDSQEHEDL